MSAFQPHGVSYFILPISFNKPKCPTKVSTQDDLPISHVNQPPSRRYSPPHPTAPAKTNDCDRLHSLPSRSKKWSSITYAALYRRIMLCNSTISRFSNLITKENVKLVKSLTLSISQTLVHLVLEGGVSYMRGNGSSATQAL